MLNALRAKASFFGLFSSKAVFLFFNSAGPCLWFMELREKCHEVGMLKEAGLSPGRCKIHGWGARVRLLPQPRPTLVVRGTKARRDKKTKMDAMLWEKRKRGELTTQEERERRFILCVCGDQTSVSAAAASGSWAVMSRAESGRAGPVKYDDASRKGHCAVRTLAADLWALLGTMKSGARGGEGIC